VSASVEELVATYHSVRGRQGVTNQTENYEEWYLHRVQARTLAVAIVERLYPTPGRPSLQDDPNG